MSEADETTRPAASEPQGKQVTRRDDSGPLNTRLGQTTIGEGVVTKVAGLAAREVPGVHELGGGVPSSGRRHE